MDEPLKCHLALYVIYTLRDEWNRYCQHVRACFASSKHRVAGHHQTHNPRQQHERPYAAKRSDRQGVERQDHLTVAFASTGPVASDDIASPCMGEENIASPLSCKKREHLHSGILSCPHGPIKVFPNTKAKFVSRDSPMGWRVGFVRERSQLPGYKQAGQ